MVKTLIFDKNVVEKIAETAAYLEQTFGKTVADKFVKNLLEKASSLKKFPEKGRKSLKFKSVRHIKVSNYQRLYYRVKGSKILVLYLFDMRQDPSKNPYE